jgi:hypothetical protein
VGSISITNGRIAWSLSGFVSAARIAGRPAVITAAQRSSARYFQRPDADHVAIDSTATSLSGWAGRLQLSKEAGEHWRGEVLLGTTSPGFETNDLGFQSRADQHTASATLEYVQEEPGRVFREWNVEVQPHARWNWAGNRTGGGVGAEASLEFLVLASRCRSSTALSRRSMTGSRAAAAHAVSQ